MAFQNVDHVAPPSPSWLVNVLRDINLSYMNIFVVYNDIFEAKLPPWSQPLHHLIAALSHIITGWFQNHRSLPGTEYSRFDYSDYRNEFDARKVDEAISKYLVTFQNGDSDEVFRKLKNLQEMVRGR
jgi:hypothetical protein